MLTNYLKTTLRNLKKNKSFSFINICGLAIGISVFIVIILFVQNEKSYDTFHKKSDRIFRIISGDPNDKNSYAGSPAPLGPALLNNFPEIENFVRIENSTGVIHHGKKVFNEKRIFYADNSIFDAFTFPFIKGDPLNALIELNSVVITESIARKYFGNEDPLGQILNLNNQDDLIITGVVRNVPENSHFHFDFLIPFKKLLYLDNWGRWNYYTYILLHQGISPDGIDKKFQKWAQRNGQEELIEGLYFQPLLKIHFQYNRYNIEPAFDEKYINIFIAVAIVILFLACINYINLSTARASFRSSEVGIKKAVGAQPISLAIQFIGESIILVFITHIFAIFLVQLILPQFNNFSGRHLSLDYANPYLWLDILLLAVSIGIFSGAYPAFILSSFNTIKALRKQTTRTGRSMLRNLLVIFQFTISISLIICALVIFHQMRLIQDKDIGINRENVINIPLHTGLFDKSEDMKNEFKKIPYVIGASVNNYMPSNMNWHQSVYWNGQKESDRTSMWIIGIDADFIKTLNIKMVEGDNFYQNIQSTDQDLFILNQSAVKHIGWSSAIGKEFSISINQKPGLVIGVTEDFHFRSLHHEVAPCVMRIRKTSSQISLRVRAAGLNTSLDAIKDVWQRFSPNFEFDYYFLSDDFYTLYKSEKIMSQLIIIFTFLSLFIACMGLFSLASFTIIQKTKEIGIRKVLGSSMSGIIVLISKEFTNWILIANIIAWPIGWYIMSSWLQNFAYRIDLTIWLFLLAGLITLVIALVTIFVQTIKAATANPVESLRYE